MPDPTIDLQRGLEVQYDFSTRYWDNQKNHIRDKSGYGRHAVASGGPSIGVSGPGEFEAASLDGGDDHFQLTNALFTHGEPFTVYGLTAPDDISGTLFGMHENTSWHLKYEAPNDRWRLTWRDGSQEYSTMGVSAVPGEFQPVFVQWDGTENLRLFRGTEDSDDAVEPNNLEDDGDNNHIGNYETSSGLESSWFAGDIASFGVWSRELSHSERAFLSSVTGPRRSIV